MHLAVKTYFVQVYAFFLLFQSNRASQKTIKLIQGLGRILNPVIAYLIHLYLFNYAPKVWNYILTIDWIGMNTIYSLD